MIGLLGLATTEIKTGSTNTLTVYAAQSCGDTYYMS